MEEAVQGEAWAPEEEEWAPLGEEGLVLVEVEGSEGVEVKVEESA